MRKRKRKASKLQQERIDAFWAENPTLKQEHRRKIVDASACLKGKQRSPHIKRSISEGMIKFWEKKKAKKERGKQK